MADAGITTTVAEVAALEAAVAIVTVLQEAVAKEVAAKEEEALLAAEEVIQEIQARAEDHQEEVILPHQGKEDREEAKKYSIVYVET